MRLWCVKKGEKRVGKKREEETGSRSGSIGVYTVCQIRIGRSEVGAAQVILLPFIVVTLRVQKLPILFDRTWTLIFSFHCIFSFTANEHLRPLSVILLLSTIKLQLFFTTREVYYQGFAILLTGALDNPKILLSLGLYPRKISQTISHRLQLGYSGWKFTSSRVNNYSALAPKDVTNHKSTSFEKTGIRIILYPFRAILMPFNKFQYLVDVMALVGQQLITRCGSTEFI